MTNKLLGTNGTFLFFLFVRSFIASFAQLECSEKQEEETIRSFMCWAFFTKRKKKKKKSTIISTPKPPASLMNYIEQSRFFLLRESTRINLFGFIVLAILVFFVNETHKSKKYTNLNPFFFWFAVDIFYANKRKERKQIPHRNDGWVKNWFCVKKICKKRSWSKKLRSKYSEMHQPFVLCKYHTKRFFQYEGVHTTQID